MKNPYTQRADILRELYRLVARHTSCKNPNLEIPELTECHLSHEAAWEECERQARQTSVARGIPFADFDRALTEANTAFRKLLHISAGAVPNPALLVPTFMKIEKRLRELALTYADDDALPASPQADRTGETAGAKPTELGICSTKASGELFHVTYPKYEKDFYAARGPDWVDIREYACRLFGLGTFDKAAMKRLLDRLWTECRKDERDGFRCEDDQRRAYEFLRTSDVARWLRDMVEGTSLANQTGPSAAPGAKPTEPITQTKPQADQDRTTGASSEAEAGDNLTPDARDRSDMPPANGEPPANQAGTMAAANKQEAMGVQLPPAEFVLA